MPDELLVRHCAPTLAGLKTANMFNCRGFIEKRDCKFCGYWKVYGDVNSAKAKFDQFSKCFRVYLKQLEKGRPVEELTVKLA